MGGACMGGLVACMGCMEVASAAWRCRGRMRTHAALQGARMLMHAGACSRACIRPLASPPLADRGIVEFSNVCQNDCSYCGIRKHQKDVHRYTMPEDEVVQVSARLRCAMCLFATVCPAAGTRRTCSASGRE